MNIAILSRDPKLYSTRRLKEAGEKRGHKVEIIDHMKCVLLIEKKNPMVWYNGRKLDYFDAVIPRIGASVTFYGAAVVRQFEMMKVFTAIESQALIRSRDKLRSMQILSRAGLGLPKTIFMDYSKDTEGVIEAVGGAPVVIKLLEGTQGLGVVLAENKKAEVASYKSLLQPLTEKLDAIERAALSFPLSNLNSWKKFTRPSYKILTWKKRLIFILCLDGSK